MLIVWISGQTAFLIPLTEVMLLLSTCFKCIPKLSIWMCGMYKRDSPSMQSIWFSHISKIVRAVKRTFAISFTIVALLFSTTYRPSYIRTIRSLPMKWCFSPDGSPPLSTFHPLNHLPPTYVYIIWRKRVRYHHYYIHSMAEAINFHYWENCFFLSVLFYYALIILENQL